MEPQPNSTPQFPLPPRRDVEDSSSVIFVSVATFVSFRPLVARLEPAPLPRTLGRLEPAPLPRTLGPFVARQSAGAVTLIRSARLQPLQSGPEPLKAFAFGETLPRAPHCQIRQLAERANPIGRAT